MKAMKHVSGGSYDFRDHMPKAKGDGDKPKLDHLRIMMSDNGGHMVEHHPAYGSYMPGMSEKPKVHVFKKGEGGKLLAHIGKALGIPHAAEEEGEPEHDKE